MAHAPALRGCFPCWHVDAGFPPDVLRLAQRQGVTERTLRGPVLEQRGRHKIISPAWRPSVGSVAELATSDVEPFPVVGVKRRCGGQREDGMHLSRSDSSRLVIGDHDRVFEIAFAPPRDALQQLLCSAGSVPGRSSRLLYAAGPLMQSASIVAAGDRLAAGPRRRLMGAPR